MMPSMLNLFKVVYNDYKGFTERGKPMKEFFIQNRPPAASQVA